MNILNELTFTFYGETFSIYYADNNRFYLPLNRLCEAIGINHDSQRRRIQNSPVMSDHATLLQLSTDYQQGERTRTVFCLDLKRLPFWLGTIDTSRVKKELRDKIILYQRELAEAAYAVFRSDMLPESVLSEVDIYLPPDQQAFYKQGDQLRDAMRLLSGMDEISRQGLSKMDKIETVLEDMRLRLGKLEYNLSTNAPLNHSQARKIQNIVAVLVSETAKRDRSRSKNEWFGFYYGVLLNEFDVPRYNQIPSSEFITAVRFLETKWKQHLPDLDPPKGLFSIDHEISLWG